MPDAIRQKNTRLSGSNELFASKFDVPDVCVVVMRDSRLQDAMPHGVLL
jgi:hypothetical protein